MRKRKRVLSMLLVLCLMVGSVLSDSGTVVAHAQTTWLNGDADASAAFSALNAFLSLDNVTKEGLQDIGYKDNLTLPFHFCPTIRPFAVTL